VEGALSLLILLLKIVFEQKSINVVCKRRLDGLQCSQAEVAAEQRLPEEIVKNSCHYENKTYAN